MSLRLPRKRRALWWLAVAICFSVTAWQLATRLVPLPPSLALPVRATTTLVDVRGRTLATLGSAEARECQPIALPEMGRWLPVATVALEDHRFYQHHGIDLRASFAACWRNVRAGRTVSGGSTISQQLIKLATGRTRRSWTAKLYENLAAVKLERTWSKERILTEYLNRNHYGNRLFGPAAAARAYFQKQPAHLTLTEAIYLAGLPQAPTRFNPWRHPAAAADRHARSVSRLETAGFFNRPEMPQNRTLPRLSARVPAPLLAPHFVATIAQKPSYLASSVVGTTLDLDLQRVAETLLDLHLARLAPRQVRHGAIVILDTRTGAVRAMVGSRDFDAPGDGQINGTRAFRSCGSTLKPFLYLHAIQDRQLTAATLLPDTPDAVRAQYIDYDPVNYDKRFLGPVRVREALANSLNVPAVVTLSRVGARRMFLAFEDYGLKFARPFSEYGAGLILGNSEIRLLDLTAAYSVFAGHGLAVEPRLLAASPVRHRYLASREAVSIVAHILADNRARQKTFGAFSPLAFEDKRIPCKTGTSSGFRDAWCVGVTRDHAVGVWVGNFDGQPMQEIAAVTGAAPLWRELIDHLLEHGDQPVEPPEAGPRLTQRDVCQLTGCVPVPESPGVISEWFLTGTEPEESAARYLRPIEGKTRLVLPAEYTLWCRSLQNHLAAELEPEVRLRVVNPAPGATFLLDPHLPRAQQSLRLLAAGPATSAEVWTVDGAPIPLVQGSHFWPLSPGHHTVEVVSASDRARADFTVE